MIEDHELPKRAARGMVFSAASYGANRALLLVATMVVTHILTPSEFGAAVAALAVASFLQLALDAGVSSAVIVGHDDDTRERSSIAATINLAMTVVLSASVLLAAPALAGAFGVPHDTNLFRLVALFLAVRGAGKVQTALLERDLDFSLRSRIEVARGVVRFVATVLLAVTGAGAAAVVWGLVAGEAVGLVWLIRAVPVRLSLHFDRRVAVPMLRFGAGMTASRFCGEIAANADYLVVGMIIGPTALGYYGVAYRLPELLILNVFWVASSVMFPFFARAVRHEADDLRRGLLKTMRLCGLFGLGVGTGLALIAPDAIAVLFGSEWNEAVRPMVFISLACGLQGVVYPVGDLLKAKGRIGLFAVAELVFATIALVLFVAAAQIGIDAVAGAHLVTSGVCVAVFLGIAAHVAAVGVRELASAIAPGVVLTAGIVIAALPLRILLPTGAASGLAIIAAGVIGGFAALRAAAPSSLRDAAEVVHLVRR
jgi:PST family polysaccharide transporter